MGPNEWQTLKQIKINGQNVRVNCLYIVTHNTTDKRPCGSLNNVIRENDYSGPVFHSAIGTVTEIKRSRRFPGLVVVTVTYDRRNHAVLHFAVHGSDHREIKWSSGLQAGLTFEDTGFEIVREADFRTRAAQ